MKPNKKINEKEDEYLNKTFFIHICIRMYVFYTSTPYTSIYLYIYILPDSK